MTAPPYLLIYTSEAEDVLADMRSRKQYATKFKKVQKTLRLLRDDPRYPSLNSHAYQSMKGPGGVTLWDSYVENKTPGAWRIFWIYGPEKDCMTIISIGPHPD